MNPTCSNCETEMERQDSYRQYESTIRYRSVKVYECPNCEATYHKKGSETIA